MKLRWVFSLFVFMMLVSCPFPSDKTTTEYPPPRPIYYHDFKELCSTTWETADGKIKIVFGSTEKDADLTYKDGSQDYQLHFEKYKYEDGVFTMESTVQTIPSSQSPWTLVFIMRPTSKTESWFNCVSGGPIGYQGGTLICK